MNPLTSHDKSSRGWIEDRAQSFRVENPELQEKVGLVASRTRAGRAAQSIGTALLPGDLSEVRSPVRSRLFSALTPGGGRRRPRLGRPNERGYRCPEGYQFGGRFTDSQWSTCGRQLFDLPNLLPSLSQIAERAIRQSQSGLGYLKPDVSPLGESEQAPGQVLSRRAADVPRVGAMNRRAREVGVTTAINALAGNGSVRSMMIRRDGFPMQPVVSTGELRKVPDNRNMEDASFLISASTIDDFGADELGLLSNTGVTSLVYVLPNGSTIRMDRTRPLTVGERRKLGKTVSAASSIDNSVNALARLDAVITDSDGAISLKKTFVGIKDPEASITGGKNKNKPRWVEEAFKGGKKRIASPKLAQETPAESGPKEAWGITNLENAIEHINKGGNLAEIDPEILLEAVRRAKVYRQKKISKGRTLFTRTDGGVGFVEVANGDQFEHLGAHITQKIQEHLGAVSPRVRIAGEGNRRPYLVQDPSSLEGGLASGARLKDAPKEDVLRILVSDYLTDTRKRNPSSLVQVGEGDNRRLVSSSNIPSGGVGLSAEELKRRRSLGLDEYMSADGKILTDELRNSTDEVRMQILEVFEDLIRRAQAFKWEDYIRQLRVDGRLSDAEERHMNIVQTLYEQRLDQLAKSRQAIASILGNQQ